MLRSIRLVEEESAERAQQVNLNCSDATRGPVGIRQDSLQ